MSEQWRKVDGFEGYWVSDLGRIKSVDRMIPSSRGVRMSRGRVLKPYVVNTGYAQVDLSGQRVSVHRVVATAWCSGYFEGAQVDHINGQRDDNRAANLEWVTTSENASRSFGLGRETPTKGKFSEEHPTSKAVVSTCLSTGKEIVWPSAMDAVRSGFDSSCISRCCKGQSKYHKGHTWRFAEYGDRHGVQWTDPDARKWEGAA